MIKELVNIFQSTITRGPLCLVECLISSDQSTTNKKVIKYSFYFHQTQIQCSGATPKHVGPSMMARGYRVMMISSHSYNPNYHICESIYYFVDYLLLIIGSCLSRSYISDKFFQLFKISFLQSFALLPTRLPTNPSRESGATIILVSYNQTLLETRIFLRVKNFSVRFLKTDRINCIFLWVFIFPCVYCHAQKNVIIILWVFVFFCQDILTPTE